MAYPQMMLVPWVAVSMAGVFFAYLFQRAALPKMFGVWLDLQVGNRPAPVAIIMALGILLIIFIFIPYFTLTSDIKMLKDSGPEPDPDLMHHSGGLGGQHVGCRRSGRQDGIDRAVQTCRIHPADSFWENSPASAGRLG